MALITCRYHSEVLGQSTSATVLLPDPSRLEGAGNRGALPVLYLLHGLEGDDSAWTRQTALERYAEHLEVAIVMPAGHRGFYTDQLAGYRYWTHLAEEVPAFMTAFFPLSRRREDTFVAGLSMGGYGAMKLALRHPERFAAAASLSGALNVVRRSRWESSEWQRTFGSIERSTEHGDDLLHLLEGVKPAAAPALYAWCGEDDFLLDDSRNFRDSCASEGVSLDYHESAGGHDWASWDTAIQRVLQWLPLSTSPQRP